MNTKQKICLLIGIIIAVCFLLCPPVIVKGHTMHRFIHEGGLRGINWTVLSIEWLITAMIFCFGMYILRDKVNRKVGD